MYNDTKIIIIYTMSNKLYIIFKVFFPWAGKVIWKHGTGDPPFWFCTG